MTPEVTSEWLDSRTNVISDDRNIWIRTIGSEVPEACEQLVFVTPELDTRINSPSTCARSRKHGGGIVLLSSLQHNISGFFIILS